ncbi:unnamed protein product, partial [marine sediment metagenome]
DYYRRHVPTRFVLGSNQRAWEDLWFADDVAPGVTEVEAYTVEAGWRLYIAGGVVSCNVSCIQNIRLVHTPGILGDFRYDMRGVFSINPPVGEILEAGDVLLYYVYNLDKVARNFSVSLVGIEEKV